jgi:hypothetical protein
MASYDILGHYAAEKQMKIITHYRKDVWRDRPVDCYADSVVRELEARGHEVTHKDINQEVDFKGHDLYLDLDNGRDQEGNFHYLQEKVSIPSAVWWIDSHGHPSLHKRLAKNYDTVFFAVWARRDLFVKHIDAHWLPNATDLKWFDGERYNLEPEFDFGFFGSRGGLDRADKLKEICAANEWTLDVRELGKSYRHRWPATAEAMAKCKFLFNRGQKHDGPNLRVLESMAMKKPLICDYDKFDATHRMFKMYEHYIPYEAYTFDGLEEACRWIIDNPNTAANIANSAYQEVKSNHLIGNRVDQILEVVCAKG